MSSWDGALKYHIAFVVKVIAPVTERMLTTGVEARRHFVEGEGFLVLLDLATIELSSQIGG